MDLIEATQIVVAAHNAMNNPRAELDVLLWARDAASLNNAGTSVLTDRIQELTTFIHRTEGGPIR